MPAGPGSRRPVPPQPGSGARKGLLWGGIAAAVLGLAVALAIVVVPKLTGGGSDIDGHWTGPYEDQYVLVDGKTVRMYYPSRDGRVAGTLDNDVIHGWWSEGDKESGGRADFRIVGNGEQVRLDGAWSFSTSDPATEWNLRRVDDTIPASVRTKLEDPAIFPTPIAG
jgi:hypothetical protein